MKDGLNNFKKDVTDPAFTNSASDLLQFTRSRQARQFVNTTSSSVGKKNDILKSLLSSSSEVKLPSSSSNRKLDKSLKNMEKPFTRSEVTAIGKELQDKLSFILYPEESELTALDSGNLYQPLKDKCSLMKLKTLNEFYVTEKEYLEQPWLKTLIKSENLALVCNETSAVLAEALSTTSVEMGGILRMLLSTRKQSFSETKSSFQTLYEAFVEMKADQTRSHDTITSLEAKLHDIEKVK